MLAKYLSAYHGNVETLHFLHFYVMTMQYALVRFRHTNHLVGLGLDHVSAYHRHS